MALAIFREKMMARQTRARLCLYCEKEVKGRADKKFCTDSCRSAFNNQRNPNDHAVIRNINYTLVRNRRILASLLANNAPSARVSRETLLQQGYQFKYNTHLLTDLNGSQLHCCYDLGYLSLGEEQLLVIRLGQLPRASGQT